MSIPTANDFLPETSSAEDDHGQGMNSDIRTVALVSLGCPKNLVDSEKMLGLLAEAGLTPTPDESQADAIVINTCGFLEASKQESIDEIRQAARRKKEGVCKRLIVAGCLVQRHRAKILNSCPDIDAMIGVFDRDRIVEAVTGAGQVREESNTATRDQPVYSSIASSSTIAKRNRRIDDGGYYEDDSARLRLTPRHYAYLRVSEGCNQNCTFCTIPSIRGKMRSKPVDRMTGELRELIADGAVEINLIGQDTTSFGQDIGYDAGLVGMLESLDQTMHQETGGLGGWLRLMYAYPSCFTDAMIDAIGRLANVVKYIDMPLQHIDDQVLTRMRRGTSRWEIEMLLGKLRDRIPGIAIRTTLITGFPGETQAQHDELVRFVREFRFDAMGVFRYSPEPGTPAGTMYHAGQAVPAEVVEQRYEELMLAQQEVAFAHNEKLAAEGAKLDVLIDAVMADDQIDEGHDQSERVNNSQIWRYAGRGTFQAPQIDGCIYIESPQELAPGEIVPCRVTAADGYDLVATPVVMQTRELTNETSGGSGGGVSLTVLG